MANHVAAETTPPFDQIDPCTCAYGPSKPYSSLVVPFHLTQGRKMPDAVISLGSRRQAASYLWCRSAVQIGMICEPSSTYISRIVHSLYSPPARLLSVPPMRSCWHIATRHWLALHLVCTLVNQSWVYTSSLVTRLRIR